MNNEGCHRLPFGRNATKTAKCINAKLVKRKHSEAMLQQKKSINTKSKVFVSHFFGSYYRYLWGKCTDLQKKERQSQGFFLIPLVPRVH